MKVRRIACLIFAALLMATGSGVHTQSTLPYAIIELRTLGGSASEAFDINASGQVVGYAWTSGDAAYHPVLWQNGSATDLGTLGGPSGAARAVNDSGQVAGTSGAHAFLWQNQMMTDLGALTDDGWSQAAAINAWGDGAGSGSTISGTGTHALRYQNGGITNLGTLGGNLSQAFGINDTGHIVGYANLPPTVAGNADDGSSSDVSHAFLWKDGVMKDLGTLGGKRSTAFAVNASGHVVGVAETSDNRKHPFLWHLDAMTNLGGPDGMHAWALDINASDQVVGFASIRNEGESDGATPLLWQNGVMTDLNTVLPPGSGWVLEVATAINDCGQIVGSGYFNGERRAFLLNPPDARDRCPRPVNSSPDRTEVPPAGQLIDATGGVWTLGAFTETVRNGIHAGGGYGRSLLWSGGVVYAYGWDDQWWRWTGVGWVVYGTQKPGATPQSPSANGTMVPPANQVIDTSGAVWTLGPGGETLRSGVHAAGGYAQSLLWRDGALYAYAWDDRWWRWMESGWARYDAVLDSRP